MIHIYKIISTLSLLALAIAAWVWVMRPAPVINAEYYIESHGKVELHKWKSQAPIKIKIPEAGK